MRAVTIHAPGFLINPPAKSRTADAARQATQYADTMLSNLEDFLNTELGDVKKSRENLTSKRGN